MLRYQYRHVKQWNGGKFNLFSCCDDDSDVDDDDFYQYWNNHKGWVRRHQISDWTVAVSRTQYAAVHTFCKIQHFSVPTFLFSSAICCDSWKVKRIFVFPHSQDDCPKAPKVPEKIQYFSFPLLGIAINSNFATKLRMPTFLNLSLSLQMSSLEFDNCDENEHWILPEIISLHIKKGQVIGFPKWVSFQKQREVLHFSNISLD